MDIRIVKNKLIQTIQMEFQRHVLKTNIMTISLVAQIVIREIVINVKVLILAPNVLVPRS